MKKYKLDRKDKIKVEDKTIYRIVALKDFSDIKEGDRGGYIESHRNLSHDDDCWVYDNAWVYGNACVYGNARVYGQSTVKGNVQLSGKVMVYDDTTIEGYHKFSGNSQFCGATYLTWGR